MAKYLLKVQADDLPDGADLEVPPFGLIKNGESAEVEIPDEEVESYKSNPSLSLSASGGKKTKKEEGGE